MDAHGRALARLAYSSLTSILDMAGHGHHRGLGGQRHHGPQRRRVGGLRAERGPENPESLSGSGDRKRGWEGMTVTVARVVRGTRTSRGPANKNQ